MSGGTGGVAKPAPPHQVVLCLDSSIVVGLLLQEPGWKAVDRVLNMAQVTVILPGPVLAESIDVARRKGNQSSGEQIYKALVARGARVENHRDEDLVRAAALLEISRDNPGPPHPVTAREGSLSLGDALILAVTERLGCQVLTRDAYWKWMVDQGLLDVVVATP